MGRVALARRGGKIHGMAEWISVTEAASLSGYHPDHLRELIREGKLKARKIVTVWQIDRASIEAYKRKVEKLGAKRGRKRHI